MTELHRVVSWCTGQGMKEAGGRLRLPMLCQAHAGDNDAIRVTMTTASIDRHGDIVLPSGADLKAFRKNPVVLWAHDYSKPPIGRVTALTRAEDRIKADVVFADTQFATEVRGLYAAGFLKAWSIGFLPKAWDVLEDPDGRFSGYKVTQWELLELSAVPIPANREALTNAVAGGLVTHRSLAKSLGVAPSESRARADDALSVAEPESRSDGTGSRDIPKAAPARFSEAEMATLAGRVAELVRNQRAETIQRAVAAALNKRMGRV